MPRPRRRRRVSYRKNFYSFKPTGVPRSTLETSVLTLGEFESIRLKDLNGLSQKESAEKMEISQPTFHRLLLSAREKVTDSIVNGKEIIIKGGEYKMPGRDQKGPLGKGLRPRRGAGNRRGFGGVNNCVCPKCGKKAPHIRGNPCIEQKCPECGTNMVPEQ